MTRVVYVWPAASWSGVPIVYEEPNMMSDGWNAAKPTKPGYYWWRADADDAPRMVEVTKGGGVIPNVYGSSGGDGHWKGPITPDIKIPFEEV